MNYHNETKAYLYALLRRFSFHVFADVYTGDLCIDLTKMCREQVQAYVKYTHASWVYQGHAHTYGWDLNRFTEKFGKISKYENSWPCTVHHLALEETRLTLIGDQSHARFHDNLSDVRALKECGPDDPVNYLLTKCSRVKRVLVGRAALHQMKRKEGFKEVHKRDPMICGEVEPLGKLSDSIEDLLIIFIFLIFDSCDIRELPYYLVLCFNGVDLIVAIFHILYSL